MFARLFTKNRVYWAYVLSLIVSIVLVAFTVISKKIDTVEVLRFAHVYEVQHPFNEGALKAAQRIKDETGGRIEMEVYPASSLGKEAGLNESLRLGIVDVIYTGAGFAGTSYGPISITDYPFILKDIDHWRAYRDSDMLKEQSIAYEEKTKTNRVVAINYFGTRHITSNKAILSPSDMKGLKIRVPNAPAYTMFPKVVGANPTPMAFSEVYLALQQGVVDAQENPLKTIQLARFYEVQSDISLTGHTTNSVLTVASGPRLDKMNVQDRDIVVRILKETAAEVSDAILRSETELVAWFEEQGVRVNQVDRSKFIQAVTPSLRSAGLPFSPEMYDRLQALASRNHEPHGTVGDEL